MCSPSAKVHFSENIDHFGTLLMIASSPAVTDWQIVFFGKFTQLPWTGQNKLKKNYDETIKVGFYRSGNLFTCFIFFFIDFA